MAKNHQWDKRAARGSKDERDPAEWMFERVATQIIEFQESLSPNEEVGVRFATAPREGAFHIKDLDCWGGPYAGGGDRVAVGIAVERVPCLPQ